jgi:16S rRNA (cytosine1402-N4)-methyltransferase
MERTHKPVLLTEVLEVLNPRPGQSYFDGTAGYGGHAAEILDKIGPEGRAILIDRDAEAVQALSARFNGSVEIRHQSYLEAAEELLEDGTLVDLILLDLGVSSPQLDQPERGFSFKGEASLDMRMDRSQSLTAAEVVNRYPEGRLADLIYQYGEERKSRRIARAIVAARPIHDTAKLADVVRRAVNEKPPHRIDPATRTFQAIRIEVNQELTQLESALPKLVELLTPEGRIAIISFHSLEDRLVKQFFSTESKDCICPPNQPVCTCQHQASLKLLTRRPIAGTIDAFNPRARSAKLRAAEKINKNKGGS